MRQFTLARWCEETWPELFQFIYIRVQNRQEAEDLTQECYLRVLARRPDEDPPPTRPYLRTVALNLIRDRWRRRRSRGTPSPIEDGLFLGEDGTAKVLDRIWLEGHLAHLTEEQRAVLRLRLVEGRSRAETAARLGCSEDAVRGLQYRALQALRERMWPSLEGRSGGRPQKSVKEVPAR